MHPVPAAKSALKGILAARPAWASVDIRDGSPTENEDVSSDAFWFEPTEIPADSWASLGAQRRRIQFRLGFVIACLDFGDAERAIEDRMWALYEDLLAAIKVNPNLGNTVQMVGDITGRQANGPAAPQQWASTFTGAIDCISKAY
jgi:hypothetical protein